MTLIDLFIKYFIDFFEKVKKNIHSIGLYLLASLIPMILNFLINPLVAINLSPNDYAIIGFYNSFISLFTPLITLYVFGYYTKRYFEIDINERIILKSTIIKTLIYISFLLTLFSLLIIYIYMKYFNKNTTIPFSPYSYLTFLNISFTGLITFILVDYKIKKDSLSYFLLSINKSILLVILTIIFVVILKLGALGKMLSILFSSLIIFIYYFIKLIKEIKKIKFDIKVFKDMLIFVWPLIIGSMLHFFTNGFDRIYLERLRDQNELGFYFVAVQITSYIGLFSSAISNTFQPDLYRSLIIKDFNNSAKYILLILSLNLLVVSLFIIFNPFLINILTAGRYLYSIKYSRILAFAQITSQLYYISNEILIIKGLTKISLLSKITGVIVTILLYSFFINKWQYIGAATSLVLSYIILMFINLVFLFFNNFFQKNIIN